MSRNQRIGAYDPCGRRSCGHSWMFHEHYRPGTECCVRGCGCARFRRSIRPTAKRLVVALAGLVLLAAVCWKGHGL